MFIVQYNLVHSLNVSTKNAKFHYMEIFEDKKNKKQFILDILNVSIVIMATIVYKKIIINKKYISTERQVKIIFKIL